MNNNKLRNSCLLLAAIFFPFFCFASFINTPLKEPGVLNVCSYTEFAPISYGNGEGYEADLIRAVAKDWQIKVRFHPIDIYEGIWKLPAKGKMCDIAIGGISPTEARMKEGARFSRTTSNFEQSLLVLKKNVETKKITSYASFKQGDMRIGVVPGTTGEQYAHLRAKENNLPMNVFVQYPNETSLLKALKEEKIQAIARGTIGNQYQASLDQSLVSIDARNFNEGFAISVDPSNTKLLEAINEEIKKLTNNNTINYETWAKNPKVFMDIVES